jgi:DNA-binding CsgD family transcriptional regulator
MDRLVDRMRVTSDTVALEVAPIVVRRAAMPAIVIRVLPVDGAARTPFLGARVILVLNDLARKPHHELELLTRTFNLTTAEARLAGLIASGASLAEAAITLGIARETVRNQVKAIFLKTDTHRQSELVGRLVRLE